MPYFSDATAASALCRALGVDADIAEWKLEFVPDKREATNVDVAWRASGGGWTYCEVKLSEGEFGAAEGDARHLTKLQEIYKPRLRGMLPGEWLEAPRFFRNYQILRNISLLAADCRSIVIFLFPRENERLGDQLEATLAALDVRSRARVVTAYVEDVVQSLSFDPALTSTSRDYGRLLERKYVVAAQALSAEAPLR